MAKRKTHRIGEIQRRRCEPEGQGDKEPRAAIAPHRQPQKFRQRRVAPLGVLDHKQHRIVRGHGRANLQKALEQTRPTPLGVRLHRRIARLRDGQMHQLRQQRHCRAGGKAKTAQPMVQLVELVVRGVILRQQRPEGKLFDKRKKRRVLVMRRAFQLDHRCPLGAQPIADLLHQPGLAAARLAAQIHHLARAVPRLFPVAEDRGKFVHPVYQRLLRGVRRGNCVGIVRTAQHPMHPDRHRKSLQMQQAKVAEFEPAGGQTPGGVRHQDLVRLGQVLQAGRDIRRLADDGPAFQRLMRPQFADHHLPGVDADADVQRHRMGLLQIAAELARGHDHFQPGMHRPLRIILMRLRVAKADQQTVAHLLGHRAAIAPDRPGAGLEVALQHLAQILGIKPGGDLGEAHQITEHDRQLSPFGHHRHAPDGPGRCPRCRFRNGVQDPFAVAQRHTQPGQITLGQVG